MFRTATLAACVLALSSSAFATGKRQHRPFTIIRELSSAAPIALSLDEADPRAGWVAAETEPEPAAAKTKADILIESMGTYVVVSYNPDLLLEEPWGETEDGATLIYAIDTAETADGDDPNGSIVIIGRDGPYADIVDPIDLTWGEVATEHLAYLVVDSAGMATIALPTTELGLTPLGE